MRYFAGTTLMTSFGENAALAPWRWNAALEATGAAQTISRDALQERALNEAAAFSIRIDVAEELARLKAAVRDEEQFAGAQLPNGVDGPVARLRARGRGRG